jgi:hypothetical protein
VHGAYAEPVLPGGLYLRLNPSRRAGPSIDVHPAPKSGVDPVGRTPTSYYWPLPTAWSKLGNVGPLWLNAHPFTSVDELLEVPGIGQRRFDQLKDLVTVG